MELLEYIRRESKCDFISDLCFTKDKSKILKALNKVDINKFSLDEFNELNSYLLGCTTSFPTKEEALSYLKNALREKK